MIEKALTTLAFFLLTGAMIAIEKAGPAANYEISIYAAYPAYFWVLLITAFALGILVLVRQAFSNKESKWWLAGLTIVIAANCILFLLPFFRGYAFFERTDNLGAVGYARDIEISGHFWTYDVYPGLHILVTSISEITKLQLNTISLILPPLFNSIFILGMFLLSRELNLKLRGSLLTVSLAAVPFYLEQFSVIPRVLCLILPPFLLYLYLKLEMYPKPSFIILFLIFLSSLVFFHPLNGGILILVVIFVILVSRVLYDLRSKTIKQILNGSIGQNAYSFLGGTTLFLLLVWFLWYSNFSLFVDLTNYISHIAEWSTPQVENLLGVSKIAGMTLYDMVSIYIKLHGQNLLYVILASFAGIYIIKNFLFKLTSVSRSIFFILFLFIIFCIITVAVFLSPTTLLKLDYTRILPYAIVFAIILIAWLFSSNTFLRFRHFAFWGILTLTLTGLLIGIFNAFPSPWTTRANPQYTHAEMTGAGWFATYQNGTSPLDGVFNHQQSLTSITGYAENPGNNGAPEDSSAPLHFSYDKNVSYGEIYTNDHYILLPEFAYIYYPKAIAAYPMTWRWTPSDIEKLHNDKSVLQIYSNGGYEIFIVKGLAKKDNL